jgi:hypothetical protein
MGQSGVAGVLIPAVMGEFLVKPFHDFISMRFCENTGGRDVQESAIAFYFCLMRDIGVGLKAIAIHGNKFWNRTQFFDGSVHRQNTGIQYVDLVNFLMTANAHGPKEGFVLDHITQGIAMRFANLFGIV